MPDAARILDPSPDGPLVDAALICSMEALREFSARPGYAFSDGEVLANLRALQALASILHAGAVTLDRAW